MCAEIDCNGGSCVFEGGDFRCVCPEYMTAASDGHTCINIDGKEFIFPHLKQQNKCYFF